MLFLQCVDVLNLKPKGYIVILLKACKIVLSFEVAYIPYPNSFGLRKLYSCCYLAVSVCVTFILRVDRLRVMCCILTNFWIWLLNSSQNFKIIQKV